MVHSVLVLVLFVINVHLYNFKTGADSLGSEPLSEKDVKHLSETTKNPPKELSDSPTNKNSSIGYRMYTRKNPNHPCFLEPNQEALKNCPIDSTYPTIFIIHGFLVDLNPGNLIEAIKDVLLERESAHVIVVDWTKYDKPPYETAVGNVYIVAGQVVKFIKFLVKYAGIQTENLTITGHSLGAQMAGVIGKKLKKLGRINGLEPAGPYFETSLSTRLSYKDADFVQVIHTSDQINGIGLYESVGHMDFYVNGGRVQPHCSYGSRFRKTSGDSQIVDNDLNFRYCNHEISLNYYINSINSTDCKFLGTKCHSYDEFQEGKCTPQNSVVGEMGAFGSKIPGLPPYSNFYLRTGSESPYCLKDGFLP